MSRFESLKGLKDADFRRLTGVKRKLFVVMVDILRAADIVLKARGGRKNTLCVEDRLLMALEYLREYRTYFHLGHSYGVSESTAYKTCRWVEDTLIADSRFSLPGKKALRGGDAGFEVVQIDATESPVQRPKKTTWLVLREKETPYDQKPGRDR